MAGNNERQIGEEALSSVQPLPSVDLTSKTEADKKNTLEIEVKLPTGSSIKAGPFGRQATVMDLKKAIKANTKSGDEAGILISQQRIIFGGKVRADTELLTDIGTTVHLAKLSDAEASEAITVEGRSIKTTVQSFTQKSTIAQLKQEVSKQTQIPTELQVIIFDGDVLRDEQTLENAGVLRNPLVFLIKKMPSSRLESAEEEAVVSTSSTVTVDNPSGQAEPLVVGINKDQEAGVASEPPPDAKKQDVLVPRP